ncbi:LOG family protein [Sulfurisphaera javensis]|uniref:LOG family protein n=1 Tax=Sulfurisphaera javensis TaxID=2049879 RepID=A0AAT9GNA3_9CREN
MQIGIAAHSGNVSQDLVKKAERFIEKISECKDVRLLLGGYWGLMKVIVDKALELNLPVILLLPIEREEVEIPEKVVKVYTGCEFRCRSVMLVRSSDVLVSLGGGVGTEIEMFMAYAMGRPVYSLINTGLSTDLLRSSFPEYFDDRKVIKIKYFDDPEKLAIAVCEEREKIKTEFG